MNVSTLEQIEIKIAFLEGAHAELSDVVFRQHQEIESLRAKIVALASRIEVERAGTEILTPEQERPPHY